jgi:hypothetical protein
MTMLSTSTAARRARRAARRGIALLGVAFALTGVAGCSSSGGTGPDDDDDLYGMYALEQVDDGGLPAKVHHGPWFDPVSTTFYNQFICYVSAASIVLTDDGEFYFELAAEWIGDGVPGNNYVGFNGTYEIDGTTIYFTPQGFSQSFVAEIDDGVIWLELDLLNVGNPRWYGFEK